MLFISSIDATSNWSIPLSIIVFITSGWGFVFTAYKTDPENFFKKYFTADSIEFILIQYNGFSG